MERMTLSWVATLSFPRRCDDRGKTVPQSTPLPRAMVCCPGARVIRSGKNFHRYLHLGWEDLDLMSTKY